MLFVKYNPFADSAIWSGRRGMLMDCCDTSGNDAIGTFCPRMDMIKDGEIFKMIVELPGVDKESIKIMVDDDILTISGERKPAADDAGQLIRSERLMGRFSRSFRLPDSIDRSGVLADYKNGLLTVAMPLKAEAKPRQIEVQVS